MSAGAPVPNPSRDRQGAGQRGRGSHGTLFVPWVFQSEPRL